MEAIDETSNCGILDLYDDLITDESNKKQEDYKKLETKYEEALARILDLEKQLEESRSSETEFRTKVETLEKNISTLLVTARSEIQRKDRELSNLRSRKSETPLFKKLLHRPNFRQRSDSANSHSENESVENRNVNIGNRKLVIPEGTSSEDITGKSSNEDKENLYEDGSKNDKYDSRKRKQCSEIDSRVDVKKYRYGKENNRNQRNPDKVYTDDDFSEREQRESKHNRESLIQHSNAQDRAKRLLEKSKRDLRRKSGEIKRPTDSRNRRKSGTDRGLRNTRSSNRDTRRNRSPESPRVSRERYSRERPPSLSSDKERQFIRKKSRSREKDNRSCEKSFSEKYSNDPCYKEVIALTNDRKREKPSENNLSSEKLKIRTHREDNDKIKTEHEKDNTGNEKSNDKDKTDLVKQSSKSRSISPTSQSTHKDLTGRRSHSKEPTSMDISNQVNKAKYDYNRRSHSKERVKLSEKISHSIYDRKSSEKRDQNTKSYIDVKGNKGENQQSLSDRKEKGSPKDTKKDKREKDNHRSKSREKRYTSSSPYRNAKDSRSCKMETPTKYSPKSLDRKDKGSSKDIEKNKRDKEKQRSNSRERRDTSSSPYRSVKDSRSSKIETPSKNDQKSLDEWDASNYRVEKNMSSDRSKDSKKVEKSHKYRHDIKQKDFGESDSDETVSSRMKSCIVKSSDSNKKNDHKKSKENKDRKSEIELEKHIKKDKDKTRKNDKQYSKDHSQLKDLEMDRAALLRELELMNDSLNQSDNSDDAVVSRNSDNNSNTQDEPTGDDKQILSENMFKPSDVIVTDKSKIKSDSTAESPKKSEKGIKDKKSKKNKKIGKEKEKKHKKSKSKETHDNSSGLSSKLKHKTERLLSSVDENRKDSLSPPEQVTPGQCFSNYSEADNSVHKEVIDTCDLKQERDNNNHDNLCKTEPVSESEFDTVNQEGKDSLSLKSQMHFRQEPYDNQVIDIVKTENQTREICSGKSEINSTEAGDQTKKICSGESEINSTETAIQTQEICSGKGENNSTETIERGSTVQNYNENCSIEKCNTLFPEQIELKPVVSLKNAHSEFCSNDVKVELDASYDSNRDSLLANTVPKHKEHLLIDVVPTILNDIERSIKEEDELLNDSIIISEDMSYTEIDNDLKVSETEVIDNEETLACKNVLENDKAVELKRPSDLVLNDDLEEGEIDSDSEDNIEKDDEKCAVSISSKTKTEDKKDGRCLVQMKGSKEELFRKDNDKVKSNSYPEKSSEKYSNHYDRYKTKNESSHVSKDRERLKHEGRKKDEHHHKSDVERKDDKRTDKKPKEKIKEREKTVDDKHSKYDKKRHEKSYDSKKDSTEKIRDGKPKSHDIDNRKEENRQRVRDDKLKNIDSDNRKKESKEKLRDNKRISNESDLRNKEKTEKVREDKPKSHDSDNRKKSRKNSGNNKKENDKSSHAVNAEHQKRSSKEDHEVVRFDRAICKDQIEDIRDVTKEDTGTIGGVELISDKKAGGKSTEDNCTDDLSVEGVNEFIKTTSEDLHLEMKNSIKHGKSKKRKRDETEVPCTKEDEVKKSPKIERSQKNLKEVHHNNTDDEKVTTKERVGLPIESYKNNSDKETYTKSNKCLSETQESSEKPRKRHKSFTKKCVDDFKYADDFMHTEEASIEQVNSTDNYFKDESCHTETTQTSVSSLKNVKVTNDLNNQNNHNKTTTQLLSDEDDIDILGLEDDNDVLNQSELLKQVAESEESHTCSRTRVWFRQPKHFESNSTIEHGLADVNDTDSCSSILIDENTTCISKRNLFSCNESQNDSLCGNNIEDIDQTRGNSTVSNNIEETIRTSQNSSQMSDSSDNEDGSERRVVTIIPAKKENDSKNENRKKSTDDSDIDTNELVPLGLKRGYKIPKKIKTGDKKSEDRKQFKLKYSEDRINDDKRKHSRSRSPQKHDKSRSFDNKYSKTNDHGTVDSPSHDRLDDGHHRHKTDKKHRSSQDEHERHSSKSKDRQYSSSEFETNQGDRHSKEKSKSYLSSDARHRHKSESKNRK